MQRAIIAEDTGDWEVCLFVLVGTDLNQRHCKLSADTARGSRRHRRQKRENLSIPVAKDINTFIEPVHLVLPGALIALVAGKLISRDFLGSDSPGMVSSSSHRESLKNHGRNSGAGSP